MALSCQQHTAYIYDRGGLRELIAITPLTRVRWGRTRDDISTADVFVATPGRKCAEQLGMIEAGRVELVIFRGTVRVWEGPVTRVAYRGDSVQITAHDVMHYVNRTAMRAEYDNRYPNTTYVLDRVKRILDAELARKEALDPPINVLQHIQYLYITPRTDARTTARTLPYEMSVFDHLDAYAARGGMDYTVVGRRILFWDVHQPIGRTAQVTADDFLGDPIITQYGMELATQVYITDGKGHHGSYGLVDPYYGEWEMVQDAYDETTGGPDDPVNDPNNPDSGPTVTEMNSQASRIWSQSKRPPIVVRIPDNTSLNPAGVLSIEDLVPGVWVPLAAMLPGRSVSQMQKLDSMTVEETAESDEVIQVTLSPAPIGS
jgi:hypothetical protein